MELWFLSITVLVPTELFFTHEFLPFHCPVFSLPLCYSEQDGNRELVLRTLDIGKSKVKVGTNDMMSVARLEDIARRTVQGKRAGPAFNVNEIVVNNDLVSHESGEQTLW